MGSSSQRPREMALFAGAGGGIWGSRLLGWETVCYVEIDAYCQRVLQARIEDGLFDDAPIWDDIKTFDGRSWRGHVDIITAGFPCQPFSSAGKQRGGADERNLWPETLRVLCEVRPPFAFLENVSGLLAKNHGYFGAILGDLASSGFDARWTVLGAADCGGPHARKRLWVLVADAESQRRPWSVCGHLQDSYQAPWAGFNASGPLDPRLSAFEAFEEGLGEPAVFGMDDGLAHRRDRLRIAGNGQVPAVVARAWKELTQ